MEDDRHVRLDREAGILTLTFTRDRKLNALSPSMLDALRSAIATLADDECARVLVIAAEGRYFTAGMDVHATGDTLGLLPEAGTSGVSFRRRYRALHQVFDELEAVEKPVVQAVQGPCLGVGLELGMSCDFRIASRRASFALPEIATLAVLPGSGGISRLTRIVGPHWARWLAMAGEAIDAEQALSIGLVHQVLPEEGFHDAVATFAQRLADLSPEALGLAKLTIDAAAGGADRVTARHVDRIANTLLVQSTEHRSQREQFPRGHAR